MDRSDRRRYFRINDWVGLSYRAIGWEDEEKIRQEGENLHIDATQVLKSLDKELTAALNALWQNNPAAASALALVNKKLDFIATELELNYGGVGDTEEESTRVNISACGMAFETAEPFEIGQKLEMRLTLKPAGNSITLIGQVVSREATEEGSAKPYFLRINFDRIDTAMQEELIQHIVRRQSRQLATKS